MKMVRMVASLLLATLAISRAAPGVTLAWDRNPETNIAGYKLKCETASATTGRTIDSQIVYIGNDTTTTVSNLNYSTTYLFTVTAYNTDGLESQPSNQVSHKTPPLGAQRLTVENGSGSDSYTPGTKVTVTADAPPKDQIFDSWIYDYQILVSRKDSTTIATIPYQDVKIRATYSDLPKYVLTVVSGIGGGRYTSGTAVSVSANSPPTGKQFSGWGGNDVTLLKDRTSAATTLTMPARAATVTANYITVYTLAVNGGTGSGSFPAGKVIQVAANPAPAGQRFSGWTGDTRNLASRSAANTTLRMPIRNTSITAIYTRR